MKGIFARKLKHGTAVYIAYTPRGEPRVRERFQTVPKGVNHSTELREAKRRAGTIGEAAKLACPQGEPAKEGDQHRGDALDLAPDQQPHLTRPHDLVHEGGDSRGECQRDVEHLRRPTRLRGSRDHRAACERALFLEEAASWGWLACG